MNKPNNPRTRLAPEQRRAQLLECAVSACAQHGVARVTHSQVSARSGVSVSAVYSYFRTRRDLVSATLMEVERFLGDCVYETMADNSQTARERFVKVAHAFAGATRETPDLLKVWLDWSTGVESEHWPHYLNVLDGLHRAYTKVIRQAKRNGEINAALPAMTAARLFSGGGHTIALMQFAGRPKREIDQFIVQLVDGALRLQTGQDG